MQQKESRYIHTSSLQVTSFKALFLFHFLYVRLHGLIYFPQSKFSVICSLRLCDSPPHWSLSSPPKSPQSDADCASFDRTGDSSIPLPSRYSPSLARSSHTNIDRMYLYILQLPGSIHQALRESHLSCTRSVLRLPAEAEATQTVKRRDAETLERPCIHTKDEC